MQTRILVMCTEDMKITDEGDRKYLEGLADSFDAVGRQGAEVDDPEGSRFVVASDTLVKRIAEKLREIARREG